MERQKQLRDDMENFKTMSAIWRERQRQEIADENLRIFEFVQKHKEKMEKEASQKMVQINCRLAQGEKLCKELTDMYVSTILMLYY